MKRGNERRKGCKSRYRVRLQSERNCYLQKSRFQVWGAFIFVVVARARASEFRRQFLRTRYVQQVYVEDKGRSIP